MFYIRPYRLTYLVAVATVAVLFLGWWAALVVAVASVDVEVR